MLSLKNNLRRIVIGLMLPLVLVAGWHYRASRPGEVIFPSIGKVLAIATHPWKRPDTVDAPSLQFSAAVSLLRVVAGFVLAVVVGVPLGLLMGRVRFLRELFSPVSNLFRVVCPVAWLPVAIVVLGGSSFAEYLYGADLAWRHEMLHEIQPAMVVIVAWGAFFPILISTVNATRNIRATLLESASLMGARGFSLFRHVVFPHALPGIMNGMRIGLGISWMVIIAAELYPGTRSGLGYTIWVSHSSVQYEYAFASIIYIMLIGLAINGLLRLVERHVGHWQAVQK